MKTITAMLFLAASAAAGVTSWPVQTAIPNIPAPLRPAPTRTICSYGDSILGQNSAMSATTTYVGATWFNFLHAFSGGALRYTYQGAIPGYSTSQMLANSLPGVLADSCQIVVSDGGTNDIIGGVSLATIEANQTAAWSRMTAAGKVVVLMTLPPINMGTDYRQKLTAYNLWIRSYAASQGYPVVDMAAIVTDPVTGQWKAGYSSDNEHPLQPAMKLIQAAAASVLAPLINGGSSVLPVTNDSATSNNYVANGVFLAGTATAAGNGWTPGTSSGHVTYSIGASGADSNFVGSTLIATCAAGTLNDTIQYTIYSTDYGGWSVGDKMVFVGKFAASGVDAGGNSLQTTISLSFFTSGYGLLQLWQPVFQWSTDVTMAQWQTPPLTIPANTTYIVLTFGNTGGTGTTKIGQIGVYNLTKLGLTNL